MPSGSLEPELKHSRAVVPARPGLQLSFQTQYQQHISGLVGSSAPALDHLMADGFWARQSEWVWSNAIVVRGEGGLTLVDPAVRCAGSLGSSLGVTAIGCRTQSRQPEPLPLEKTGSDTA
jgi:hypothetical protein